MLSAPGLLRLPYSLDHCQQSISLHWLAGPHRAGRQAALDIVSLPPQEAAQWLPSSSLHVSAWALLHSLDSVQASVSGVAWLSV